MRADRPRPGPRRQGRRVRARRDRRAAGEGPASSQDQANRLTALVTGSTDKAAFADADFVIEAVFEELDGQEAGVRRGRGRRRPSLRARHQHVVAVGHRRWRARLEHPERVVGFHFFNPVAVMPLLEIVRGRAHRRRDAGHGVRGRQAAEEVLRAGQGRPGVRRQPAAHPRARRGRRRRSTRAPRSRSPTPRVEPLGTADVAVRAARSWSARRSPSTPRETLHEAFPDRFGASAGIQARGRGRQDRRLHLGGRQARRRPRGGRARGRAATAPPTADEVLDRARDALAEEIRLMLDEGVVAAAAGHRPVPDPRRRLAVLERRHHARTWTAPACPSGSPGERFLPPGVASVPELTARPDRGAAVPRCRGALRRCAGPWRSTPPCS